MPIRIASDGCAASRRAFTFVETIVALALVAVIAGGLYSLSGSGSRLFLRGADKSRLLQDGTLALLQLAGEIEQCQAVVKPPSAFARPDDGPCAGRGLQVRAFVDPASPDFGVAPYRTDRLVEYASKPSRFAGRYDLVRTESALNGSGAWQKLLLEGALTEPALFAADSSATRFVRISLRLAEAEQRHDRFRGTVELNQTVYLHSCH